MHELGLRVERMDKMAAAREINPFSFGNVVLHGCDT